MLDLVIGVSVSFGVEFAKLHLDHMPLFPASYTG